MDASSGSSFSARSNGGERLLRAVRASRRACPSSLCHLETGPAPARRPVAEIAPPRRRVRPPGQTSRRAHHAAAASGCSSTARAASRLASPWRPSDTRMSTAVVERLQLRRCAQQRLTRGLHRLRSPTGVAQERSRARPATTSSVGSRRIACAGRMRRPRPDAATRAPPTRAAATPPPRGARARARAAGPRPHVRASSAAAATSAASRSGSSNRGGSTLRSMIASSAVARLHGLGRGGAVLPVRRVDDDVEPVGAPQPDRCRPSRGPRPATSS